MTEDDQDDQDDREGTTISDLIERWWQMGYETGVSGQVNTVNPFLHGGPGRTWWRRGWRAGWWAYVVSQSGGTP